ncbi:serine/threonine-protein phosphatase 4 regulatory subunit 3B-like [Chamaea fasciata]|uniref:serine/threonine-protein phosphatase 4 regulatory subunit 3B-like n=1 Tax=Chamaea fasciata TaxID=190680 RepID=UPI003369D92E
MGGIGNFTDLPTCELPRLAELAELVTSVHTSCSQSATLALALKSEGYIPKLLELFQICERQKNTEALHLLFHTVRGIVYLDQAILFEVLFSDQCIQAVAGCLEYDPCLPQPAQHRESLAKTAKLHEVIPIKDPHLKERISQAFRAQYILAIITPKPSDFEGGRLSTLKSFISSSKEKILCGLQKDEAFLPAVLAQLTNEATPAEQQCQLMKIFNEFCAFSLSFRERRKEFLQTLLKLQILPILEKLMAMDNLQVRSAATDILSYLVQFSPATAQDFVLQEARQSENDTHLITKVIEQMICTTDPQFGGKHQLMKILCALINTDKMMARISHLEVFEFLDIFYDRYIQLLTAPLLAATSEPYQEIDNYQKAKILASVLAMLSYCVQRHQYHMKMYVTKKDLLRPALVLMKSKRKFLALSALRFMRKIIGLKDDLYNRYITLGNLFEPVLNAVLYNKDKRNLLKSTSMEMFKFIQRENIQLLIAHLVENFSDALESVKPTQAFQGLKTKQDPAKEEERKKVDSVPSALPVETRAKEPTVSPVREDLKFSAGEGKAAATSKPSCSDSSTTYRSLTTALEFPKRGLFEIFGFHDDEDDETPPKKRARRDP